MDIVVKIIIPEGEYTKWNEYERGGIYLVKKQLRSDIRSELDSLGIEGGIEIKSE
jgi:hypothetical protein